MPSKKIYVQPYKVKGHHRIIYTRVFKFICAHCDKEAKRETYATVCPKYCDDCKNIKNKRGTKKQPSGEIVETAKVISQSLQESLTQQIEVDSDTPKATMQTSTPETKQLVSNQQIISSAPSKQSNKKETKQAKETKKAKDSQQTTVNKVEEIPPLEGSILIEFINQLWLIHYNKTMNADSKHLLIDLWDGKNYDQITEERKMRIKTVRKIASDLMTQLSNAMGENVNPRNLQEVMNKHYRAYKISEGSPK